jgi:hypothetical protein
MAMPSSTLSITRAPRRPTIGCSLGNDKLTGGPEADQFFFDSALNLRALSVILRECNLTRAAELLETTQPSISKILARLREHFGDPLVLRDGHGMQLTPRAIELAERLPHLLAASAELTTSSRRSIQAHPIAASNSWSPMLAV